MPDTTRPWSQAPAARAAPSPSSSAGRSRPERRSEGSAPGSASPAATTAASPSRTGTGSSATPALARVIRRIALAAKPRTGTKASAASGARARGTRQQRHERESGHRDEHQRRERGYRRQAARPATRPPAARPPRRPGGGALTRPPSGSGHAGEAPEGGARGRLYRALAHGSCPPESRAPPRRGRRAPGRLGRRARRARRRPGRRTIRALHRRGLDQGGRQVREAAGRGQAAPGRRRCATSLEALRSGVFVNDGRPVVAAATPRPGAASARAERDDDGDGPLTAGLGVAALALGLCAAGAAARRALTVRRLAVGALAAAAALLAGRLRLRRRGRRRHPPSGRCRPTSWAWWPTTSWPATRAYKRRTAARMAQSGVGPGAAVLRLGAARAGARASSTPRATTTSCASSPGGGIRALPVLVNPPPHRSTAPAAGAERGSYPPRDFEEFGELRGQAGRAATAPAATSGPRSPR